MDNQRAKIWQKQIREALFVSEEPSNLDPETHSSFEPMPGIVAERVSYGTQFGMRIPSIVYRPAKPPEAGSPALIIVNGHGGDKFSWYAFYSGMLYAQAGAVVLTYDPTGEGERNRDRESGTRAHDQKEAPDELAQRLAGLMQTDLMQAVTFLSQRPEVDPERIGAMGYSMGTFVVAVAGAIEKRLHACVLAGGGNLDGYGEYWDHSKPMCQGTPYRSLAFLGDRGPALYALHALRGPTLACNGEADTTVNMPKTGAPFFKDLRDRTVQLLGSERGVFDYEMVPLAAHRPHFVTRPVALWLSVALGFPHWTPTDIRKMGETHVSAWAEREGVDMDPFYVSEEREGGTRALCEGIPGLTREDLSVYGDAQWRDMKDQLTHEAWRARVRKLL